MKVDVILRGVEVTDLPRISQLLESVADASVQMHGRRLGNFEGRRASVLQANQDVDGLLHEFVAHLRRNEPDVYLSQKKGAITIVMPSGLRAGLRPFASGLRLSYRRDGERSDCWIRSDIDFETAVSWLRRISPRRRNGR